MNDPIDNQHQEGDEIDELDAGIDKVIREFFDSEVTRVGATPDPAPRTSGAEAEEATFVMPRHVGRYPVTALIGRGGLGVVLRATDPELGREIAIKIIRPKYHCDDDVIASFLAEARVTSQLQHPGIVPIHEVGRTAEGLPFFTMKIVEGDTLALLLRQRQMPQEERLRFLRLFAQVCHAVAFAHDAGVVHRDLKPGNVMVGRFGEVQIVDWGFAVSTRAASGDQPSAPEPGPTPDCDSSRVLGTAAYMAPEQAHGNLDRIDARTDVFALGATLTEILTGAPPYLAETLEGVYLKATKGWQQDANERLDACGADEVLVALAKQCLSPGQQERPADAAAVAAGIERYLTGLDQKNRELQIQAAEARAYAKDERRRRRLTLGMAIAVGVAVISAGSYWWIKTGAQKALRPVVSRAPVYVEQAQQGEPADAAWWDEARVAVEQAATFARSDSVVHPEIAGLLEQVQAGDAQAQKDRAFLDWLSGSRLQLAYDLTVGSEGLDTEYTKEFAQWGVDVVTLDADSAAAVIRSSRIAIELVNGLDRLVEFLRLSTARTAPTVTILRKLTAIAIAADRDSWRNRVRQASLESDLGTLQALAQTHEAENAPRASLDLLARSLRVQGDQQTAISVLRMAVARWPGDYQMVHSLELCMHGTGAPPREILWLSLLGVSIRPDSPHAWHHLANAFDANGDMELARQALQRMRELGPNYPLAASVLTLRRGRELLDQGYVAAAANLFQRLAENEPGSDAAMFFLAVAKSALGDSDAAIQALRAALAIRETAERRCNLGMQLREIGRFEEALDELTRGHELSKQRLNWQYPSGEWIQSVEGMQDRAVLLAEHDETKLPAGAKERAETALVALFVGRPRTALRLFREAFAREPALAADRDRGPDYCEASYREFAAQAAVRAATSQDGEGTDMTATDRTEALQQALVWLREDLDSLEARAVMQGNRDSLRSCLSRFLHGSVLAPLHADQPRNSLGLDAAQLAAWRSFWTRVEGGLVKQPGPAASTSSTSGQKK